MEEPIEVSTRPPSATDEILLNKFEEDIASQPQRLDDLAKWLVSLQLGIPGLYAAALKLAAGKDAPLSIDWLIMIAFALWCASLFLSLWALFPKTYKVDRYLVRDSREPNPNQTLSVEGYFQLSTRYKYRRILGSCICFFVGITLSIYSIL